MCPLCRGKLPAGPEQLFDEAIRRYFVMDARAKRGQTSWSALSTFDKREVKEVMQLYKNAAAQGLIDAAYNLWFMYHSGQVVEQDYAEAVKWLRKPAEQGLAKAQYNLGIAFQNGEGVRQDYAEAVKWYRKAAEQGHANAQYNIGALYYNGPQGVQQDFSEAVFWFEKSASQGNDQAKWALEQLRLVQKRAPSADLQGTPSGALSLCAHCAAQPPSGTSLKSCSRCGTVFYCGCDCQLAHWKAGHKKSCNSCN